MRYILLCVEKSWGVETGNEVKRDPLLQATWLWHSHWQGTGS